jgi:hypothetical protein
MKDNQPMPHAPGYEYWINETANLWFVIVLSQKATGKEHVWTQAVRLGEDAKWKASRLGAHMASLTESQCDQMMKGK